MARILLIDDEKIARVVYGDYLTGAGHEVTAVEKFAEAKSAISVSPYDVVVTDLLLSDGDGMQVLEHVKSRFPGVEVVVITALDKVDPAVRAIKSGAAEYLVKPVSPEALQHAVTRALTTRQLLWENEKLRQHVALLETGQRIATTLERERLTRTTTTAFAHATGASGVLLYLRQGGELRPESAEGLVPEERMHIDAVIGRPMDLDSMRKLGPAAGFQSIWVLPAREGETTFGLAVLLFKSQPAPEAEASAQYLARHFGLALRNIGRFSEVEDLAYLDDLTHLFNVRYLEIVLEREIQGAHQQAGQFTVLFLDLDYFKNINDTHGHLVGSRLLVEVGRVLQGCVRDQDVVARYGGDEYVVLLRGTDSGGALKVAERIRRTVEMHQFLSREGYAIQITTCIGIASYPEHAADKQTLIDFADRAMYRGKKTTRNVVYMASSGLEATPAARHSTPTRPLAPAGAERG